MLLKLELQSIISEASLAYMDKGIGILLFGVKKNFSGPNCVACSKTLAVILEVPLHPLHLYQGGNRTENKPIGSKPLTSD